VDSAPAAAIDLGTNTALLVVGRRGENSSIEILQDAHAIVRLGEGVDRRGMLTPAAIERAIVQIEKYVAQARALGAQHIAAWGTSALRDASNRQVLIEGVKRACAIDLGVLSGADEAKLTFRGAAFAMDLPASYGVIDIGGGSTEVAFGTSKGLEAFSSLDIGAVRLSERFFPHLPPSPAQLHAAQTTIESALEMLFAYPGRTPLVGVAGTATTLGALAAGLDRFDDSALNGYFLTTARTSALTDHLLSLSLAAICSQSAIGPARADIIGAGSLILKTFLQKYQCPGLYISTRGIRYGLLEKMLS
jgi:exopolyphosphatase / guanosine-5'-triphosphate,3'-diphosphate pyrophosphatase